jgi:hypothetical protein
MMACQDLKDHQDWYRYWIVVAMPETAYQGRHCLDTSCTLGKNDAGQPEMVVFLLLCTQL